MLDEVIELSVLEYTPVAIVMLHPTSLSLQTTDTGKSVPNAERTFKYHDLWTPRKLKLGAPINSTQFPEQGSPAM